MDVLMAVIIAVVIILVIVFAVWWFGIGSTTATHQITFNGKDVFSSANIIPNTSDGTKLIYYGTLSGVFAYDTTTGKSTLVSPVVVSGLAYSGGNLLAIDQDGNYYNLSESNQPIIDKVTSLYSTKDGGYEIVLDGKESFNGSKIAANGNYGNIIYSII